MGSVSNQNPWTSYDTYKDCSQGLCSIYCPQWCYVFTPPPPYFPGYTQDEDSDIDFSPLIIAIVGILASAFLLICYYTLVSKYCMRRRSNRDTNLEFNDYHTNVESSQGESKGLDEILIKSITVCKYIKGDGLVEGTECSVCLSEFQENENLRLLPKCNHAFHLPCIDTWLQSNCSCPLCRSNIATADSLPPQPLAASQEFHPYVNISAHECQHRNDTILVIQDIERGVNQECIVSTIEDVQTKAPTLVSTDEAVDTTSSNAIQPVRRSISMNSLCQNRISIADILLVREDDDEILVESSDVSIEIESSRHPGEEHGKSDDRKGILHLVRDPSAIKRSISTGRFMFTRYGNYGRNHITPN